MITIHEHELDAQADAAAGLLSGGTVAVLTGAGVSTDSGIPDYRGEGAQPRAPMTFQQFLADERYRKRYWAGSHVGWKRFSSVHPNAGHSALADLEHSGAVNGVITQNVDGLHLEAGSRRVVDLHGTMDRVRCLDCGQIFAREDVATRLAELNPWLEAPDAVRLAPDGDVDVEDIDSFQIPACTVCGGTLKPQVVFFGELVPAQKFSEARSLIAAADALVIAGSSLMVNSGIRLLEVARKRHMPIVIINRGVTKGDGRSALKIDAGTTEILTRLRDRLV